MTAGARQPVPQLALHQWSFSCTVPAVLPSIFTLSHQQQCIYLLAVSAFLSLSPLTSKSSLLLL